MNLYIIVGMKCDPETGNCDGYIKCLTACPTGTWGSNCSNTCNCLHGARCNLKTGKLKKKYI